jgi:hypothetical protein
MYLLGRELASPGLSPPGARATVRDAQLQRACQFPDGYVKWSFNKRLQAFDTPVGATSPRHDALNSRDPSRFASTRQAA